MPIVVFAEVILTQRMKGIEVRAMKKRPSRVLPEKRRDESAPTMLFSGMLTKFYLLEEARSIGSTDPLVGSLAIATEADGMVGISRPTLSEHRDIRGYPAHSLVAE
jgi:hypothetical protein